MTNKVAIQERSWLSPLESMGSRDVTAGMNRVVMQPENMQQCMALAEMMSRGNFVPKHLREKPGDCLAVVLQSARWGMDPFAVGSKTFFVNDRMAYEAQLVAAVVNSSGVLEGRLKVTWSGTGEKMTCLVRGKIKGDDEILEREVILEDIKTRNSPLWKTDTRQQLGYYTQRAWARLYTPEVLLGVYSPDEFEDYPSMGRKSSAGAPLSASMLIEQAEGGNASERADGAHKQAEEVEGGNQTSKQGSDQEQHGEAEEEDPKWLQIVRGMRGRLAAVTTKEAFLEVDKEWCDKIRAGIPDEGLINEIEQQFARKRKYLQTKQSKES